MLLLLRPEMPDNDDFAMYDASTQEVWTISSPSGDAWQVVRDPANPGLNIVPAGSQQQLPKYEELFPVGPPPVGGQHAEQLEQPQLIEQPQPQQETAAAALSERLEVSVAGSEALTVSGESVTINESSDDRRRT